MVTSQGLGLLSPPPMAAPPSLPQVLEPTGTWRPQGCPPGGFSQAPVSTGAQELCPVPLGMGVVMTALGCLTLTAL